MPEDVNNLDEGSQEAAGEQLISNDDVADQFTAMLTDESTETGTQDAAPEAATVEQSEEAVSEQPETVRDELGRFVTEQKDDSKPDSDLTYAQDKIGEELSDTEKLHVQQAITHIRQKDKEYTDSLRQRAVDGDILSGLMQDESTAQVILAKLSGQQPVQKIAEPEAFNFEYEDEESFIKLMKDRYPEWMKSQMAPVIQEMVKRSVDEVTMDMRSRQGAREWQDSFGTLRGKYGETIVSKYENAINQAFNAVDLQKTSVTSADELVEQMLWQVAGPELAKILSQAQAQENNKVNALKQDTQVTGQRRPIQGAQDTKILQAIYDATERGDVSSASASLDDLDAQLGESLRE